MISIATSEPGTTKRLKRESTGNVRMRLTALAFGQLWTLIKDRDDIAEVLGYEPAPSEAYLIGQAWCLPEKLSTIRISWFLKTNGIELVEEHVYPHGGPNPSEGWFPNGDKVSGMAPAYLGAM